MSRLIIEGGVPLRGEISVLGAKNVGFKLMIASLLGSGVSVIHNIPQVADVFLVKEIIEALGGKVTIVGHTVTIDPKGIKHNKVPLRLGEKARASSMLIPVLLHYFGEGVVPYPGGDKIGRRPIDRHLKGLERLGAIFRLEEGHLRASGKLRGGNFKFNKITHTGTETLILGASIASGETILENCALEPEVDDLINFLTKMGAKIERQGGLVHIYGVSKLNGAEYTIMPDQNEVVTFACMALATKGNITIRNTNNDHIVAFLEALTQIGAQFEDNGDSLRVYWEEPIRATTVVTRPFPGFKTDWQPVFTALMTQAEGESTIHETVFEHRFHYVPFLNAMGAKIELFNHDVPNPDEFYNFNLSDDRPEYFHSARVFGPTRLNSTEVEVPDIRAGATLTLAALSANGSTVLTGIEHIERGYEKLEERLKNLGAKITKTDD